MILRERTSSARAKKDALELELARVEMSSQENAQRLARVQEEREQNRAALERASELRRRASEISTEIARLEQELVDLGTSETVIRDTREQLLARLAPGAKRPN